VPVFFGEQTRGVEGRRSRGGQAGPQRMSAVGAIRSVSFSGEGAHVVRGCFSPAVLLRRARPGPVGATK